MEQLEELLNKATKKQVLTKDRACTDDYWCPCCGRLFDIEVEELYNYCPSCGQALAWFPTHIDETGRQVAD